ncbi:predicted protein [Histoplasma capsulatum G186AR]|uniref:Uncharacterized protein n=1 Tax=Ajellomyces capsulatus (strain G186AR / H82 / ATCC MYA-2454 / RMSCC 2432) TaxID=447093 RepID=C0NMH5_AJECG|nr:uncharacterized protein HCBG_03952 [Histoplasma capsulatum G186AR]EEH07073.1 predicted protein [Histoplasma capsulatum G186AR]
MGTPYEYQQASKCAPGQVIIEPRRPLSVQRLFLVKCELLPDSLETGQDLWTTAINLKCTVLSENIGQQCPPRDEMNNAGGVISALYRCLPTAFTVRIMSSSKDRAPSDTATLTGTGVVLLGPPKVSWTNSFGKVRNLILDDDDDDPHGIDQVPHETVAMNSSVILTAAASPIPPNGGRIHVVNGEMAPEGTRTYAETCGSNLININ